MFEVIRVTLWDIGVPALLEVGVHVHAIDTLRGEFRNGFVDEIPELTRKSPKRVVVRVREDDSLEVLAQPSELVDDLPVVGPGPDFALACGEVVRIPVEDHCDVGRYDEADFFLTEALLWDGAPSPKMSANTSANSESHRADSISGLFLAQ